MQRLTIYGLITLILVSSTAAQVTTFAKTFGGANGDGGNCICQTFDGGYLVAGYTESLGDSRDIYLTKVSAEGDFLWSKTIWGAGNEEAQDVIQMPDGGFVIVGGTDIYGSENADVLLVRTDPEGNFLWLRTYGGERSDIGNGVKITSEGGLIVVGSTDVFDGLYWTSDAYLIKTDDQGVTQWERTFGGSDHFAYGYAVCETASGLYTLAGTIRPDGQSNIYMVAVDANGWPVWERSIDIAGHWDNGYDIIPKADGYVVVGQAYFWTPGYYRVCLLGIDTDGEVTWQSTFTPGVASCGLSIKETEGGGYIIAGVATLNKVSTGWCDDLCLIRVDSDGDEIWSRTIGGAENDLGKGVVQTSDGGFLAVGFCSSYGAGGYDVWLVKTDSEGILDDIGPQAPRITFAQPTAGSEWSIDQTMPVTWTSEGDVPDIIDLYLSNDAGASWEPNPLAHFEYTSVDHFYWTIPRPVPVTYSALKIVASNDGGVCEVVSELFAIYEAKSLGTTVIVHGWNPDLSTDEGLDNDASWVIEMGREIVDRLGAGILYRVVDGEVENEAGEYDQLDSEGHGERVILFDWIAESNIPKTGYLEAAADALAAVLIDRHGELWDLGQLHFIGHSRGAVVCSEAIERLGLYASAAEVPGIDLDMHLTTLDPHPWDNLDGDCISQSIIAGSADDYAVNSENIAAATGAFEAGCIRQAVVCWQNVAYADNFYQEDCSESHQLPNGLHAYIGLNLNDTANVHVSDLWGDDVAGLDHSAVHDWYLGTIDHDVTHEGFYPGGENTRLGFNIGPNFPYSPMDKLIPSEQVSVSQDDSLEYGKIFNGDFNMVIGPFTFDFPGWGFHGGGGWGTIDEQEGRDFLRLSGLVPTGRRHNTLYVPKMAVAVEFWVRVERNDPGEGEGDQLEFRIGDELIGEPFVLEEKTARGGEIKRFSIPPHYKGTVQTIELNITDPGSGWPDSEVWIDNIEFDFDDEPSLLVAGTCPIDLAVTDPLGNVLSNSVRQIEGATYDTYEVAEGDSISVLKIKTPVHQGAYHIQVTPWPSAAPDEQFSITASYGDKVTLIAAAETIENIPADGFSYEISCCLDRVGDANNSGDDEPTIGDVSAMIDALFISGTFEGTIDCLAEADINQSGGPNPTPDDITIGDISILIDYLFISGAYDPVTNPDGSQLPNCL